MTYNPLSQNNDDHFYTAVCAYVRGEPNGIVPGTVGEEQAEIAKRLLQDNPAILDDKDRLLAKIATIHYRGTWRNSPVFQAKWSDGVVTRMSVFCREGKLDLGRAVRLSWHAYDSRTKGKGTAKLIVAGQFESEGEVLQTYQNIDPCEHRKGASS
jgi:hypothetical protein